MGSHCCRRDGWAAVPSEAEVLGGRKALVLPSPGREEKGDLVSPSLQSRRWFTAAGEEAGAAGTKGRAQQHRLQGCWLCSCPLGETEMLPEPVWRALLKALSAFSSFFCPFFVQQAEAICRKQRHV